MHDFEIKPYVGVGDINFGIGRKQVHSILGAPSIASKTWNGYTLDYWGDDNSLSVIYSNEQTVQEISFSPSRNKLFLDDILLFASGREDIHYQLCERDGSPYHSLGCTILFKYGIVLDQFKDEDADQKVVSVFKQGTWDIVEDELEALPQNEW